MGMGNLKNAAIALITPVPSILFYLYFLNDPLMWKSWCYHHPLLLANLLFFFNIDLLFWLISFLLSSHWVCSLLTFSFQLLLRTQNSDSDVNDVYKFIGILSSFYKLVPHHLSWYFSCSLCAHSLYLLMHSF